MTFRNCTDISWITVIGICQGLKERDFTMKVESVARKRKGKREYLNDVETDRMMKERDYF
ncbi:hypothetical protein CL673_08235 [Candidatus Bathyarchaeota archaeon]|nr:hypothetical protein [Candidatus Bathyarchaeota archaeon]